MANPLSLELWWSNRMCELMLRNEWGSHSIGLKN